LEIINDRKQLMLLLLKTGETMLQCGAETYRVEDTMKRMALSRNMQQFDSFVTPTGIFVSSEYDDEVFSYIRRIKSISIDLQKVSDLNNFSRLFVASEMPISDGLKTLNYIREGSDFKPYLKWICGGLASAGFTKLFGGNYIDLIPSFLAGVALLYICSFTNKNNISILVNNIIGGMIITLIALCFQFIIPSFNIGPIISGSIMPLAPGVAITNAIRDFIYGDYLSGVSRAVEALIIAIGIAFGVGIILNTSNMLGGLL